MLKMSFTRRKCHEKVVVGGWVRQILGLDGSMWRSQFALKALWIEAINVFWELFRHRCKWCLTLGGELWYLPTCSQGACASCLGSRVRVLRWGHAVLGNTQPLNLVKGSLDTLRCTEYSARLAWQVLLFFDNWIENVEQWCKCIEVVALGPNSKNTFMRVWSWLRMNAGGAPNTCKSSEKT